MVYNGLWFTPLREALDAFFETTSETTTGEVTLRLYKGNIEPVSRKSPYSLYSLNIASFTMGAEYDQKDAQGFINLIGLPIRVRAQAAKQCECMSTTPTGRQWPQMKLWGGRFEAGPSEVFERFSGSLHFDKTPAGCRLPRLAGFRAGAGARRHSDRRRTPTIGGRSFRADPHRSSRSLRFFDGATDEDVHTLVIRKLKERVGGLADKIHTGRSRNEQVSLDVRLWLREQIDAISRLLVDVMGALVGMARRYPHAFVPGYTHTRRAQAGARGRTTCWRISKCSRAITSVSPSARAAST